MLQLSHVIQSYFTQDKEHRCKRYKPRVPNIRSAHRKGKRDPLFLSLSRRSHFLDTTSLAYVSYVYNKKHLDRKSIKDCLKSKFNSPFIANQDYTNLSSMVYHILYDYNLYVSCIKEANQAAQCTTVKRIRHNTNNSAFSLVNYTSSTWHNLIQKNYTTEFQRACTRTHFNTR